MGEPATDPAIAAWTRWESRRAANRRGWMRLAFPGLFLAYLAQTGAGVSKYAHGVTAAAGFALLVLFCNLYLWALPTSWAKGFRRHFWLLVAAMIAAYACETLIAHEQAYVMAVFITVLFVAALPRYWVAIVAFFTATAMYVPLAFPSWHEGVNYSPAFVIPLVAAAMYGFFRIMEANHALAEARTEVVRLAAENERVRIARDLHDVLGHSLTTITVKAELAGRLAERQPERAAAEIAQVEALARRALADVRAAISGYRDVTLAGELSTGREVLRAAGITPVFPTAVDTVRPEHHELFGWVVREGLTNVVRHARARTCTVTLGPDSVEVVDDGAGAPAAAGNGLTGLRERVAAAGGTIEAGPRQGGGWRLLVEAFRGDGTSAPSPAPPACSRDDGACTAGQAGSGLLRIPSPWPSAS